MVDYEIKKYKTRNNIVINKLDYQTLIQVIKIGCNLSLYKNTFIKIPLKNKRIMNNTTIVEYSNNKPFSLFGLNFKKLDNDRFITKEHFGNEDIVLSKGYLIVNKKDTLLTVFNKLNNGLQFYLL